MRTLSKFGALLALAISTSSAAWADCRFNEAEGLNSKIKSEIVIAKTHYGWTEEMDARLEEIINRFIKVGEQHTAAENADDLAALSPVCDDYQAILVEIEELTKPLK